MKYPAIRKPETSPKQLEWIQNNLRSVEFRQSLTETLPTARALGTRDVSSARTRVMNPEIISVAPKHLLGVAVFATHGTLYLGHQLNEEALQNCHCRTTFDLPRRFAEFDATVKGEHELGKKSR